MMKEKGVVGFGALLFSSTVFAQVGDMPGGPQVNQLNLTRGVTQVSSDIMDLHWLLLVICVVIFIGVFGVMLYSVVMHRKSRGAVAAKFHENVGVEVAWTVIPFLIIIAMAIPATRAVVAMKDTTSADLTVMATGYQWMWGYEYLNGPAEGLKFLARLSTPRDQIEGRAEKSDTYLMETDNHLVVPVDKKVRVVLTANDVIHSWMVPDFGVKQDAMPGVLRDTWFRAKEPGIYRGQCAELCGKDHAFMPIVVEVMEQADYERWAAEQMQARQAAADDPTKTYELDELMTRGEKVYAATCIACHQANGQGMPPTFPPLVGAEATVLAPMQNQIDIVLNGRPGTAMAPFRDLLNDVEIASVITYTRHAWGHQGKGPDPIVQPADVTAQR
ncbi:cytochrome c oxidase subunit II [Achromobacter sp. F4_2707]|uniref:cytochrome c oxidase subunit II n=1 Tax=Achromobacter sp. F4_2707 TaxID=3114286 RepID=UPI0039C6ABF0